MSKEILIDEKVLREKKASQVMMRIYVDKFYPNQVNLRDFKESFVLPENVDWFELNFPEAKEELEDIPHSKFFVGELDNGLAAQQERIINLAIDRINLLTKEVAELKKQG